MVNLTLELAEKQHNNAVEDVSKVENLSSLMIAGLDTLREPLWYNLTMLEGRCPKCGCCYAGWALRFPRNQSCSMCCAVLEISEDGHLQSLLTSYCRRVFYKSTPSVPPSDDKEKIGLDQMTTADSPKILFHLRKQAMHN